MSKFRITFGQQYRHTPHPVLGYMPKLPDGWVTVDGADENDARNVVNTLIGQAWAFIYPDDSDTFGEEFYPRGCLGRLEDLVPKQEPKGTESWQRRKADGRELHGLGASTYLPGNVQHLVSPIVGNLRLIEQDGKTPDAEDVAFWIDRLSFVLELAREEDERLRQESPTTTP